MLTFERKVRQHPEASQLPDELDNIHVVSRLVHLLDSNASVLGLHTL